jgi:hypothetical protein
MLYESQWWGLTESVTRVTGARGARPDAVQIGICQAISERAIPLRCGLLRRAIDNFCAPGKELNERQIDIPSDLKPEDFDWENSRPKQPWPPHRGTVKPPGLWYMDIKLFGPDVMKALCPSPDRGGPRQNALSGARPDATAATGEALADDRDSRLGTGPQERSEPVLRRRRGRRPYRFEPTVSAMRADVLQGRLSMAKLRNMLEKELVERYGGVSRTVARKARDAVLSELEALNSGQIPTNDN